MQGRTTFPPFLPTFWLINKSYTLRFGYFINWGQLSTYYKMEAPAPNASTPSRSIYDVTLHSLTPLYTRFPRLFRILCFFM